MSESWMLELRFGAGDPVFTVVSQHVETEEIIEAEKVAHTLWADVFRSVSSSEGSLMLVGLAGPTLHLGAFYAFVAVPRPSWVPLSLGLDCVHIVLPGSTTIA
jgi:hypothetical protein